MGKANDTDVLVTNWPKYVPNNVGAEMAKGMLFVHAFTGCMHGTTIQDADMKILERFVVVAHV